jgi:transcription factor SOX1/3/14/21 (SOX group B)
MAASQMGQVGSYYNPAAAAYGSLSAASMAAAAAAAAAQQSAISGLSAPAQVRSDNPVYLPKKTNLSRG